MIDFRYHLVSIISIFLALAVGIVLGAGPLQQQIGTTLTSEVTQLRKDKTDLRQQLDAATTREKARGAFVTEALPRIVAGSLAGRGVALVVLPGVKKDLVQQTSRTIEASGAALTTTVTIQDTWVSADEETAAARDAAAQAAAAALALPPATDEGASVPDRVLSAALATSEGRTSVSGTAAKKALEELVKAKLIEVSTLDINPAQHVVVISAPITGGGTQGRQTTAKGWVRLCRTLDAASLGTVVLSDDGPDPVTEAASVVSALRSDTDASFAVSTIDNATEPLGQVSVPFALIQQEGNESGHFGIGADASAPYAPIPTT